jgi:hypothetical protein
MFEDNIVPFNGLKLEDLLYISEFNHKLRLAKKYKTISLCGILYVELKYTGETSSIFDVKMRLLVYTIINLENIGYRVTYCVSGDRYIFSRDDKFLDEAWNLAMEHKLLFGRLGDAIRRLGYVPEYDYQFVNIKSARKV